jgi:hypothetical protein
MTKIPRNYQSDQNISKPLKWPQYHRNIQNDKNKLETYQITKIPQNDKNDQNILETSKMTKIRLKPPKYLGGKVSTYLVILGAKCHFSKIRYRECNFVIPRGCQSIPFFSFYFPSSTKIIQNNFQYAFYSGTKLFQTYNHLSKTMKIEYPTQIKLIRNQKGKWFP